MNEAVRDFTIDYSWDVFPRLSTCGTCVRLDVLCLAYQISLVPKTATFNPEPKNDGNRLVGAFLCGAFFSVFRSTLQGY